MRTHHYRIMISGGLDDTGREAFGDFLLESTGANTILAGYLDQAALYGALNRILMLGFELLALTRVEEASAATERTA